MSEFKCPKCNADAKYQIKDGSGFYCKACGSSYNVSAAETGDFLVSKYLGGNKKKTVNVNDETELDSMPLEKLMKIAYSNEQEECGLAKAFKCFKIAAERGDVEAMYKVAYAYEKGRGTEKNDDSAYFWYGEGKKNGNQRCERILAERFSDRLKAEDGSSPAVKSGGVRIGRGLTLPELCERLLPSVVRIHNIVGRSEGTGFIVSGGYIITNAHVISFTDGNGDTCVANEVIISFHPDVSAKKYMAKVVAYELRQDMAILKSESCSHLADYALRFADSDKVRIGEDVFTIGNGEGLGIAFTKLYVSQKAGLNEAHLKYDEVLQLSGGTNHGNSGGPVFNMDGDVVGIITFGHLEYKGKKLQVQEVDGQMRVSEANDFAVAQNMSFAITSNTVRRLAAKININL